MVGNGEEARDDVRHSDTIAKGDRLILIPCSSAHSVPAIADETVEYHKNHCGTLNRAGTHTRAFEAEWG